ncbi:MAG: rhodanese-like domain-containing protein [Gemmatimonadota bacterium]
MPPKAPPRKKVKVRTVVSLLFLLASAVGLLWDGAPLAGLAIDRAVGYKFGSVKRMSPDELVTWMRDPTRTPPLWLDIRTAAEYDVSHIDGAIRLDPKQPDLAPLQNVSRHSPVVLYSAAGIGATAMAQALGQANFDTLIVMRGGLFRWVNEGHSVVKDHAPVSQVHPFNAKWGRLLKSRYHASVPDADGIP